MVMGISGNFLAAPSNIFDIIHRPSCLVSMGHVRLVLPPNCNFHSMLKKR